MRPRMLVVILAGLFLGATPSGAQAGVTPLTEPVQVSNLTPAGTLLHAAAETAAAYDPGRDRYLVVFDGNPADVNDWDIHGRFVSRDGQPNGESFQISQSPVAPGNVRQAFNPSVAYSAAADQFFVVWTADAAATDDEEEVFGQRLSGTGAELGGDVQLSTTGADGDGRQAISAVGVVYNAQSAEYMVVWSSDASALGEIEVYAQRVSTSGAEMGGDIRVTNAGVDGETVRGAGQPSVAYSPAANEYLVVFTADTLTANDEFEIFAQRVTATGIRPEPPQRVSVTGAEGAVSTLAVDPEVAWHSDTGEWLVVWDSEHLGGGEHEIFAQRLSASLAEQGGDFRVSSTGTDGDTTRDAGDPAVIADPFGDEWLVSWEAELQPDAAREIFLQRLSMTGAEAAPEERITTTGSDTQNQFDAQDSVIAEGGGGRFLIAWIADALGVDDDNEVFARILGPPPTTSTTQTPNDTATTATPQPSPAAATPPVPAPVPLAPARPPAIALPSPTFASVVQLPGARRCVSRRQFRIAIRALRGVKYRTVTVHVNGRRARVVRGTRTRARIDLRGLPKGRVRVRITVVTTTGKRITGSRLYRTCAPKRRT